MKQKLTYHTILPDPHTGEVKSATVLYTYWPHQQGGFDHGVQVEPDSEAEIEITSVKFGAALPAMAEKEVLEYLSIETIAKIEKEIWNNRAQQYSEQ